MIRGFAVTALLLFQVNAHAGTVSFYLENSWIEGQMTISGNGISPGQTSYDIVNVADYTVSFSFDYGDGFIDYTANSGYIYLDDYSSGPPNSYWTPNGVDVMLTETITDPGQTTDWRFIQFYDSVPGNPYDDVLLLRNLGTNESYDDYYPSEGHHLWVQQSVVPIPAAVWLFGSALAGLGWARRKQTVRKN